MLWLSCNDFARVACISDQRARLVCAEFRDGIRQHFRGAEITVRVVHGRGGSSGLQHLVKLSSLPPDLQARWKALQSPVEQVFNARSGDAGKRRELWFLHHLSPALDAPLRSAERAAVVEALAGRELLDWNNYPTKLSKRTWQRQLERLEVHGAAGLAGLQRADKGKARNIVTRAWDDAVLFSAELKARLAELLKLHLAGLFKADFRYGQVCTLGAEHLAFLTAEAGFDAGGDPAALLRLCRVPRPWVSDAKLLRVVSDSSSRRCGNGSGTG